MLDFELSYVHNELYFNHVINRCLDDDDVNPNGLEEILLISHCKIGDETE